MRKLFIGALASAILAIGGASPAFASTHHRHHHHAPPVVCAASRVLTIVDHANGTLTTGASVFSGEKVTTISELLPSGLYGKVTRTLTLVRADPYDGYVVTLSPALPLADRGTDINMTASSFTC